MPIDEYRPEGTEPNADPSSDFARQGQSQNTGGQSQGQAQQNDQPLGQDNGTVATDGTGTQTENLVADNDPDDGDDDAKTLDYRDVGGEADTQAANNPDAVQTTIGGLDDRLTDEPDTSERSDNDDTQEEEGDEDGLTPEDRIPAAEI